MRDTPLGHLKFFLLTSLALFNLGVGYWGAFAIHAARMGRIAAHRAKTSRGQFEVGEASVFQPSIRTQDA